MCCLPAFFLCPGGLSVCSECRLLEWLSVNTTTWTGSAVFMVNMADWDIDDCDAT